MKIGFFGNTNNFPFMLARAFRRLDHEVLFVVHRQESLHRPEFRYRDLTIPYPEWVREVPFPDAVSFVVGNPLRREALRLLQSCDFVVLNDLGISLAAMIGRPYLALLTGSDLSYYCDPRSGQRVMADITTRNPFKRLWGSWVWRRLLQAQRDGVRQADLVFHFARGLIPGNDAILDEIGVEDSRRLFFLMADVGEVPCTPAPNNARPRTFCATRLTWKKPLLPGDSPLDFKGSDVMVQGLGRFYRRAALPLDIHLVRKGRHVAETMRLVEQEGLDSLTTWHEEMSQAEVWHQYRLADIVFEQFDQGIVAMAGLEAMAAGRPVIANGRPGILEPLLGEPSPICQAATPNQVCEQLHRLTTDQTERARVGRSSRDWVEKHFSPEAAAQRILDRISRGKTAVRQP